MRAAVLDRVHGPGAVEHADLEILPGRPGAWRRAGARGGGTRRSVCGTPLIIPTAGIGFRPIRVRGRENAQVWTPRVRLSTYEAPDADMDIAHPRRARRHRSCGDWSPPRSRCPTTSVPSATVPTPVGTVTTPAVTTPAVSTPAVPTPAVTGPDHVGQTPSASQVVSGVTQTAGSTANHLVSGAGSAVGGASRAVGAPGAGSSGAPSSQGSGSAGRPAPPARPGHRRPPAGPPRRRPGLDGAATTSPAGAMVTHTPALRSAATARRAAARENRRLRSLVARLSGCVGALPAGQSRLLTLRAGLAGDAPLSAVGDCAFARYLRRRMRRGSSAARCAPCAPPAAPRAPRPRAGVPAGAPVGTTVLVASSPTLSGATGASSATRAAPPGRARARGRAPCRGQARCRERPGAARAPARTVVSPWLRPPPPWAAELWERRSSCRRGSAHRRRRGRDPAP